MPARLSFLIAQAVGLLSESLLLGFILSDGSDALSGGAGWAGASILGGVLGWLLFVHLPAKDKQIERLIEGKDAALKEQRDDCLAAMTAQIGTFAAAITQQRGDFQAALGQVMRHCQDEVAAMSGSSREATEALKDGIREAVTVVREWSKRGGGVP